MFPVQDSIRSRTFPLVNWLIIIANIVVFVFVELPLAPAQLDQLIFRYGLIPNQLFPFQPQGVLSIFTSMFLHGGWAHLISNLWALYLFGDNVEDRMGQGRYLIFYLLGGVAAVLVQTWTEPTARVPMIGASGAIAAVLGAYLVLFPSSRVTTIVPVFFLPWFLEIPAVIYLVLWFALQFFNGLLALETTTALAGVAYWAHIGGFVFGLLMVKFFTYRRRTHYQWYSN